MALGTTMAARQPALAFPPPPPPTVCCPSGDSFAGLTLCSGFTRLPNNGQCYYGVNCPMGMVLEYVGATCDSPFTGGSGTFLLTCPGTTVGQSYRCVPRNP